MTKTRLSLCEEEAWFFCLGGNIKTYCKTENTTFCESIDGIEIPERGKAMILKVRTKPKTLLMREYLARRMKFTQKEQDIFQQQAKGYPGECQLDERMQVLECDCLIINDLLLEVQGTTFQIDKLLITEDKLFLYEVKNYRGNYYYESDKMFLQSGKEIKNPFHQLTDATSALRRLIQQLGYSFQLEPAVVFINPLFYLYQAPRDLPVIFHSQLEQHLKRLNRIRTPIGHRHRQLAEKLITLHKEDNEYEKFPKYQYADLRKGLICERCDSFTIQESGHYCQCQDCGSKERTADMVLKAVAEFHFLFAKERITKQAIFKWCQVIQDSGKNQRILSANLTKIGTTSGTYYEPNEAWVSRIYSKNSE